MNARHHVDHDEARRLRGSGLSIRQTAQRLGCSERQVTRLTGRMGAKTPMTAEQIETVERLLNDGAPCSEAARTVGVTPTTIYRKWPGRSWSHAESGRFGRAVQKANGQMSSGGSNA